MIGSLWVQDLIVARYSRYFWILSSSAFPRMLWLPIPLVQQEDRRPEKHDQYISVCVAFVWNKCGVANDLYAEEPTTNFTDPYEMKERPEDTTFGFIRRGITNNTIKTSHFESHPICVLTCKTRTHAFVYRIYSNIVRVFLISVLRKK